MDNGESSYRRFLEGNKDALTEIIREYKDSLTFFINGITNNMVVAEDIVQETFIKLYVKKPRFNGKSSFKTWLYRIGRNTAVDYIRHHRRAEMISLDNSTEYVESDYFKDDRDNTLHAAIKNLKDEYSLILWLTYFEGMSINEASVILGKSKNNTSVLLHRAKDALRKELLKEGLDYEDI